MRRMKRNQVNTPLPAGVPTTNTGHDWMALLCLSLDSWICASHPWYGHGLWNRCTIIVWNVIYMRYGCTFGKIGISQGGGSCGLICATLRSQYWKQQWFWRASKCLNSIWGKNKTFTSLSTVGNASNGTFYTISIGHNWIYWYESWLQSLCPSIIGSWISFEMIMAASMSFPAGRRSSRRYRRNSGKHQYGQNNSTPFKYTISLQVRRCGWPWRHF